jgi:hypothetical protein
MYADVLSIRDRLKMGGKKFNFNRFEDFAKYKNSIGKLLC